MAGNELRIPIKHNGAEFTIVDNGDGIYESIRGSDHLELIDGTLVSEKDPRISAFLKEFGLESFNNVRVKSFNDFVVLWKQKTVQLQSIDNKAAAIKMYKELNRQSRRAYLDFSSTSPLFEKFMELAGKYGCYVILDFADSSASYGSLEAMHEELEEATTCKANHSLSDSAFDSEVAEIEMKGYRVVTKGILKDATSDANYPDIEAMNKNLEKAEKIATEGGILSEFKDTMLQIRYAGYKKRVEGVLEEATSDANYPDIEAMNKNLEKAEKIATEGKIIAEFEKEISNIHHSGYQKRTQEILKEAMSDANYPDIEAMNKNLEKAEKIATEGGVLPEFKKEMTSIRKSGYEKKVVEVLGEANSQVQWEDIKKMNEWLGKAEALINESGLKEFTDKVEDIRKQGYLKVAMAKIEECKSQIEWGSVKKARESLDSAKEIAKKGKVDKDKDFIKKIAEVENAIKALEILKKNQ